MKEQRAILKKDDVIINSFPNMNAAYFKLQKIQSASADWAMKYEGYAVEEAELIPIENIKLKRAEGPTTEDDPFMNSRAKARVLNFREADLILNIWRENAHSDKIDFWINFADGDDYKGTFILLDNEEPDLQRHVKGFLETYGGIKKPDHFTPQQWQQFKEREGEQNLQQAKDFYNTYDIHTD